MGWFSCWGSVVGRPNGLPATFPKARFCATERGEDRALGPGGFRLGTRIVHLLSRSRLGCRLFFAIQKGDHNSQRFNLRLDSCAIALFLPQDLVNIFHCCPPFCLPQTLQNHPDFRGEEMHLTHFDAGFVLSRAAF